MYQFPQGAKKNVLNYFWNWKQVTLNGKLLIMRVDLSVKLHAAFTIRVNEENTRWSSNSPVTPHIKRLAMWTCMATATDDVIWYPTTVETLSPWLIQKRRVVHFLVVSSLLQLRKKSCMRIARFGQVRLFRRDAQRTPLRARSEYGMQRARAHTERTDTRGRDFAITIAFLQIEKQMVVMLIDLCSMCSKTFCVQCSHSF